MMQPSALRSDAERLASPLPALMAEAERLAATVVLGTHGRRRAGMGDEFWQYRPAMPGDSARMIDWRRSARSDAQFVQEKEWQAAQSVLFWVDPGQSMAFSSDTDIPRKADRARVLALALAILLTRGGERIALASDPMPLAQGEAHLQRIAEQLGQAQAPDEYARPTLGAAPAGSRAVFLSDFLGDIAPLGEQLARAADIGIQGVLFQVLDPQEESFPFQGRTIFESVGQTISHETLKASDLRGRYLARLSERKAELADLAKLSGWRYHLHHSDQTAAPALLWLYGALAGGT